MKIEIEDKTFTEKVSSLFSTKSFAVSSVDDMGVLPHTNVSYTGDLAAGNILSSYQI